MTAIRFTHEHKDEFSLGDFPVREADRESQHGDTMAYGFWFRPEGAPDVTAIPAFCSQTPEPIEIPW